MGASKRKGTSWCAYFAAGSKRKKCVIHGFRRIFFSWKMLRKMCAKRSLFSSMPPYGDLYSTAIIDKLGLNQEQRYLVSMYALLNQISWACENGIQFNQNTRAKVDEDKKCRDQAMIKKLASELGIMESH